MQKITTFLWFDKNAEDAAKFYVSLFKNSKINSISHYLADNPSGKTGEVMGVIFELDGREYYALNGGKHFKLTPAVSLYVNCDTQEEIDTLWDKLTSDGGQASQCGWLTDKFGLTWQIVPRILPELMSEKHPAKAKRVMEAFMKMVKYDIAELQRAYDAG